MNMNVFSRAAKFITASAVALTSVLSPLGADLFSVPAASLMSAAAITEDMGVGWNLGNSLDSTGTGTYSDITQYEQQWGNPVVTQSLINTVKAKGFNTVRVPVSWYQHISNDGKYTIDTKWLARVKEVVDYAYNQDMYVILNIHHEEWINRSDFSSAGSAMETQLRAVWLQIADYFSDYDQKLIFEGMNEPRAVGSSIEWTGDSSCYAVVNQLNEAFVETVRSVESPYKSTRVLMIPGYAASCSDDVYASLSVPKVSGSIDADSDGDDDYIAVSIHAYSPYNFAMGEGDHSEFSASYRSELLNIFSNIDSKFLEQGVPVVIGEFSASNFGYDDARVEWAEFYMENATKYGMPCVLWDNNVDTNSGSESHGYVKRSDNSWYSSGEKVVNTLISVRNSTDWDIISHPMYIHDDVSNGISISYADDGNITAANIPDFASGTEVAIVYSNSEIPEAALMDANWGGWTVISPYDYDPDIKTAYVSYDQIQESWSSSNALNYIKITNASASGIKGVYLLDIPSQDGIKINEKNFPDSVFRSCVSDSFDADKNGVLSEDEISAVTSISVSDKGIASLAGIEFFTEITKLSADGNKLTGVDLSKNTKLTSCDLSDNCYELGTVGDTYSLSELPECFDITKTSEWSGAEFDSSSNVLKNFISKTVTYTYDCGNNITAQFRLDTGLSILYDEATGCYIVFEDDVNITSDMSISIEKTDADSEVDGAVSLYTIGLNGGSIDDGKQFKVYLKLQDTVAEPVIYAEDGSEYTLLESEYNSENNMIIFSADSFGVFVLAEKYSLSGDYDGDGTVNNKDLTIVRRHLAGEEQDITADGDMNGDGVINNKDLVLLRRKLAGNDA